MRPEVSDVVDKLIDSRMPSWLQVIDDAKLDQPAAGEPTPEAVIEPYRWLLRRVGEGLRLTQAGYLPPAVVAEAMDALRWREGWMIGKHNSENRARPIRELRESAQRFGLLSNNRGLLLVTKLGRKLAADPYGLWWHLAARLPDAWSEAERQAGVLYLLTVAAGRPGDDALLADGMSILGWVHGDAWRPLSASDAFDAVRDTWVIFRRLGLISTRAPWDAPELPPSDAGIRLARAALLGQGDPSSPARSSDDRWPAARAVQLTVILRDIEPPIWRRLLVPATMALRELHGVIQTAMGWEDYHLHMFDIDGVLYGHVEEIEDEPLGDEATFTVGQAAGAVSEFSYEYDFGDRWRHDIRIEQVTASVGMVTSQLIDGARACPPEDCGGSSGYAHLLEVLADPTHKDHNLTAQWVGGAYDPEAFDLAEPNASLELYDRVSRQRRLRSR